MTKPTPQDQPLKANTATTSSQHSRSSQLAARTDHSDLVDRAQRGDVAAFEALYRLYEKRIFALCLRMMRNEALAEEMLQEGFLRAWRKLNTFKGDSQFSTWLYRITSNLIISYFRSQGNWDHDPDAVEFLTAPDELHHHLQSSDLEQGVRELPEKARMVLIMHDIEGYAHHEIAELLGIAVGTSKAQLHRARRLLVEYFNEQP